MFSTKIRLIQRTGKNGINRYDFLKLLAIEYRMTTSKDAKEQVLANLANFAYDPVNYGYIRQLKIIDLFLHALSEQNLTLVSFAISGICNLCLDSINKIYILRNRGVELVVALLSSQNEDVILSAISTLMFLVTPESKDEITSTEIIKHMLELSCNTNIRIKNLANIFLHDCCDESEVKKIKEENNKINE